MDTKTMAIMFDHMTPETIVEFMRTVKATAYKREFTHNELCMMFAARHGLIRNLGEDKAAEMLKDFKVT